MCQVNRDSAFLYFVYPFAFQGENFTEHCRAIDQAPYAEKIDQEAYYDALDKIQENPRLDNKATFARKPLWEAQNFPQDDLLSYVAQYLNPTQNTPPTAHLWKLSDQVESPYDLSRHLGFKYDWDLLTPQGKRIPFGWGKENQNQLVVQLALFKIGVGFLTVQAQPKRNQLEDWLDFIHYFRFLQGKRGVKVQGDKRIGFSETLQTPRSHPYFPDFAGGVIDHREGVGTLDEILFPLLETGSGEKGGCWWEEVFIPGQLLPFVGLSVQGVGEAEIPSLLYQVRNFFHSKQGNHPSEADLELAHPNLLPYAARQWFVFSLDGGGFVGVDMPETEFFQRTLIEHLRENYFLLFLLTLHQRFALMTLSAQVAEYWLVGEQEKQRERTFQRIRDQLLSFTARGYFTQAMQREHHHRCYLRWQQVFQVEQFYREVSTEVQEMHEYLLQQRTKRVEDRLNFLGVFIGIPGLIIGFLGINLRNITAGEDGIPLSVALLVGVVVGVVLSLLFWWRVRD
ncbi:CorA family divalent cation transporter [Spirulina sp. CS-785/01]|uniref:CorA family divalent cation transporter n=1 Tax=Spirulina sp. CS-785/01 TaxID=3021716 RepID=UPI00232BCA7E|nr:CorA family divalent cation transporter [Spirulina sp. CS-785/01]MDB9313857.1 CorA family divalent cation transporter [Spirulina sp. CS-785/01]